MPPLSECSWALLSGFCQSSEPDLVPGRQPSTLPRREYLLRTRHYRSAERTGREATILVATWWWAGEMTTRFSKIMSKLMTLTIALIIGDHPCSASGSQKTLKKQFQWWWQQSKNQRQCTEETIIFSTDFKTEWGKWQYGDNVLCHKNSQLIIAAS